MYPEEMPRYEDESLEAAAGKDQVERSENWSFPATPPATGVPQAVPVPEEPMPEEEPVLAEEVWEDEWPPTTQEPLEWGEEVAPPVPKTRRRGTLEPGGERPQLPITPQQKLLLLDTWQRSGLPARDFGALVNISHHTLYSWKKRFEEMGPAGLINQPKGVKKGSKLPELTKRTILMLKQAHPDWGCERISGWRFQSGSRRYEKSRLSICSGNGSSLREQRTQARWTLHLGLCVERRG